ncbi:unnamed protein product [Brassica rapa subsp. narinosa]
MEISHLDLHVTGVCYLCHHIMPMLHLIIFSVATFRNLRWIKLQDANPFVSTFKITRHNLLKFSLGLISLLRSDLAFVPFYLSEMLVTTIWWEP